MIAITPWRRRLATLAHPAQDLYTINPEYLQGVEQAGDIGTMVAHVDTVDEAKLVLQQFDGLLLSGGADMEPSRYGAENTDSIETSTSADSSDIAYLQAAMALDVPVLAICRGLQVLNVALGGTLHQHILGTADHPEKEKTGDRLADAEAMWDARHDVILSPGSGLHRIFGADTVRVNTLHHQAVDRVADGLTVTATAPDGTIEGLEHETAPIIAVQWHPEQLLEADDATPSHLCLFEWLTAR